MLFNKMEKTPTFGKHMGINQEFDPLCTKALRVSRRERLSNTPSQKKSLKSGIEGLISFFISSSQIF